jgi:glycosyltransferase involved in cell wall biosynthesis
LKNLLLIPLSYPYDIGCEDSFLKNEVPFYLKNFDKVFILPCKKSESRVPIDPDIIVDHSLIDYNEGGKSKLLRFLKAIKSGGIFLNELFGNVKKTTTFRGFKKLSANYLLVCRYISFFELFFENKKEGEWLIYTYWFTPVTTAAAFFASKNEYIKTVTRAHGIDLYEFRNDNYIPFRKKSVELLNKYFFVSDFGKQYTQYLYPQFINKLEVFPLAVQDTKVTAKTSESGFLSIVSCSSVDHNKRVGYILDAVMDLGCNNKELKITWNHFGAGPLLKELEVEARKRLMDNVECFFHGYVETDTIIKFYSENVIDVFITTTASEGGRVVSIMEALCCSIPVIATRVGGIPEIVNDSDGILLNENPTVQEISTALKWFSENKEEAIEKRQAARDTWQQKCDPDKNFSGFVKYLASI